MSGEFTIEDIFAQRPNIEKQVIIEAIMSEASNGTSSAELRRFLLTLAYYERRKSLTETSPEEESPHDEESTPLSESKSQDLYWNEASPQNAA